MTISAVRRSCASVLAVALSCWSVPQHAYGHAPATDEPTEASAEPASASAEADAAETDPAASSEVDEHDTGEGAADPDGPESEPEASAESDAAQDDVARQDEPEPAVASAAESDPRDANDEAGREPATQAAATFEEPASRSERWRDRLSSDRLLLRGGIVAISVGLAASIPMFIGIASGAQAESLLREYDASPAVGNPMEQARQERIRIDIMRQGQTMNRLAIGTGIVAGVYLTGGLVLVGLALAGKRGRDRRATIAPTVARDQAGFLLQGRF